MKLTKYKSLAFLFLGTLLVSCSLSDVKKKFQEISRKHDIEDSLVVDSVSKKWNYETIVDEMSPDKMYNATRYASRIVKLSFPAGAILTPRIEINNTKGVNYIGLVIGSGTFMLNPSKDNYALIRIDSAEPSYYHIYPHEKGGGLIYIEPADTLINAIKKAKTVRVQVNIVSNGSKIFYFNVSGLKWEYKTTAKKQNAKTSVYITSREADMFHRSGNSASTANVSVSSNSYSGSKNASSLPNPNSSNSLNQFVIMDTKEHVDKQNDKVTLTCRCRNNRSDENTVTIRAYFMDADNKVLAVKSVSLSCSGNMQLTTDISATGITGNYKTFKVEVQ